MAFYILRQSGWRDNSFSLPFRDFQRFAAFDPSDSFRHAPGWASRATKALLAMAVDGGIGASMFLLFSPALGCRNYAHRHGAGLGEVWAVGNLPRGLATDVTLRWWLAWRGLS